MLSSPGYIFAYSRFQQAYIHRVPRVETMLPGCHVRKNGINVKTLFKRPYLATMGIVIHSQKSSLDSYMYISILLPF